MKKEIFILILTFFSFLSLYAKGAKDQEISLGEDQELHTFYLAKGGVMEIPLPKVEILSGMGKDSVITLDPSQEITLNLNKGFHEKGFTGFNVVPDKNDSVTPHLLIFLKQPYDAKTNTYSSASVFILFRLEGYILKCDFEMYFVAKKKWEKIAQLVLNGDRKSDQLQFNALIARVRLSNFLLEKLAVSRVPPTESNLL